jgi:predicted amino acid racemase
VYHEGAEPQVTPNLAALITAKGILERLGIDVAQVNAAGNTAVNTMSFLAERGVTHVEPGSALTGSSTFHLFDDYLPEQPDEASQMNIPKAFASMPTSEFHQSPLPGNRNAA